MTLSSASLRAELPSFRLLSIYEDPEPQGDFSSLSIPLRRIGNLILVEAKIDTLIGNFILDTGAPYLVLNSTYFRDYDTSPELMAGDINGSANPVMSTLIKRLEIRDLFYEDVQADIANLGNIENKRGVKILGLMGINLFKQLELEMDVSGLTMNIYRLNRDGERMDGPAGHKKAQVIPFSLINDVMIMKGKINGKKLKLCFDSGAEVTVLDNRLPEDVYQLVQINARKNLVGSSGSSVEVLFGNLRGLDLGYSVNSASVIISDLNLMGRSYGQRIDGIIGYDLLKEGIVSINFIKQQIRVEPLR